MGTEVTMFLLALAVSSVCFAAAVAVLILLARPASSALRYRVLLASITALLALPVLSTVLPKWRVPFDAGHLLGLRNEHALHVGPVDRIPAGETGEGLSSVGLMEDAWSSTSSGAGRVAASKPGAVTLEPVNPIAGDPVAVLPLIWIIGCLGVAVTQALRWVAARHIARNSKVLTDKRILSLYKQVTANSGLSGRAVLVVSTITPGAMVWGMFRQQIILPATCTGWPDNKVQLILKHELIHITRRDNLFQVLLMVVLSVYWFNAFVWLLARWLHVEREMSCDDRVIGSGVVPSDYATYLLEALNDFRGFKRSRAAEPIIALSSCLRSRFKNILNPRAHSRTASRIVTGVAVGVVLFLSMSLSVIHPWSQAVAENQPTGTTSKHEDTALPNGTGKSSMGDARPADEPYEPATMSQITGALSDVLGYVPASGVRVRGSGRVVEQTHEISGIHAVHVATLGTLYIKVGENERLTIEAEDNIIEQITVDVHQDHLVISAKPNVLLYTSTPVEYHLTVRQLDAIEITGSCSVVAPAFEAPHFSVTILGSGDLKMDRLTCSKLEAVLRGSGSASIKKLTAGELAVEMSGSGGLELAGGAVDEQAVIIYGSGSYDARDLEADRADVQLYGGGDAHVRVRSRLFARTCENGNLYYYGDPHIDHRGTGSGKIRRAGG